MQTDQQDTGIPEDDEDDFSNTMTEGIILWIGKGTSDEIEGKVEVCEGEVGEEEGDELVDEFDMEKDFADNGMIGLPDLSEVDE